jgi:hypothetical protein
MQSSGPASRVSRTPTTGLSPFPNFQEIKIKLKFHDNIFLGVFQTVVTYNDL